jgi:hypothetical protein
VWGSPRGGRSRRLRERNWPNGPASLNGGQWRNPFERMPEAHLSYSFRQSQLRNPYGHERDLIPSSTSCIYLTGYIGGGPEVRLHLIIL